MKMTILDAIEAIKLYGERHLDLKRPIKNIHITPETVDGNTGLTIRIDVEEAK